MGLITSSERIYFTSSSKNSDTNNKNKEIEAIKAELEEWLGLNAPNLPADAMNQLIEDRRKYGENSFPYRALLRLAANKQIVKDAKYEMSGQDLLDFNKNDIIKSMNDMEKEIRKASDKLVKDGVDINNLPDRFMGQGLNRIESVFAVAYPNEYNIWKDASTSASIDPVLQYGLPGFKDHTRANAFKHSEWNAMLTTAMGADRAKVWTDAHEFGVKMGNQHYLMDLQNNQKGRELGLALQKEDTLSKDDIYDRYADFYGTSDDYSKLWPFTAGNIKATEEKGNLVILGKLGDKENDYKPLEILQSGRRK